MTSDALNAAERGATRVARTLVSPRFDRPCVIFGPRGRLSPTPPLYRQQAAADHEQVGQRRSDLQAVQVLRQAAVAYLLESEHPLDHPDAVLDLGAHPGLVAVLGLDGFIHPLTKAIAAVRAVAGAGSHRADRIGLTLVGLIPQTQVSFPCSRCGRAWESATFAAEAST